MSRDIHDVIPWMRLVHDSDAIPARSAFEKNIDSSQLSLPFPEPDIVIILNIHDIRYATFSSALNYIKPKWIFDIRATPRLDRIARSRKDALREFERIGSHYVDLFGLLGISSYRNVAANPYFWTPVVEEFLRSSKDNSGPYLALLDNDMLINSLSKQFASSISHATGKSVALSKLAEEAL